jgi:hypothetical protein
VGGVDPSVLAEGEPSVKYHPVCIRRLTPFRETGRGTVLGGQFDWGGLLQKSNGGVQRRAQAGWQSVVERMGRSPLDCETYGSSSSESWPK